MDIKPRRRRQDIGGIRRRQTRHKIGDFKRMRRLKQVEIREGRAKSAPREAATDKDTSKKPFAFNVNIDDIDENQHEAEKKTFFTRFKPAYIRRNFTIKGMLKKLGLLMGVLALSVIGYLGYKLYFAAQNIIDRDSGGALALRANIDPSELNGEGDGRVNILLIGIGGPGHQGGTLADTIIVASIDPFNKDVAMLSIPRDLWVNIPGQWTTKINAAHALGEDANFSESGYPSGGPGLLQKTVEQVLDIPIHYYVRVDFSGFKQAIDAVGGVTVDVPETICDYKIAWEFGFTCINAGRQDLNSTQALFYARTRASTRGDFDRGERQRLILLALRDKILRIGTFTNPVTVGNLLDAAGSHVRTNLSISEMLRVYDIVSEIPADRIVSAGLDDYVSTTTINNLSVVVPKAGNFEEIQSYAHSIFIDGFIKKENATIDVYNGSGIAGLATKVANELKGYGYNIKVIGTYPETGFIDTKLYDLSGGANPFTQRLLEQRFNTFAKGASNLTGVESNSSFVIILGKDASR